MVPQMNLRMILVNIYAPVVGFSVVTRWLPPYEARRMVMEPHQLPPLWVVQGLGFRYPPDYQCDDTFNCNRVWVT